MNDGRRSCRSDLFLKKVSLSQTYRYPNTFSTVATLTQHEPWKRYCIINWQSIIIIIGEFESWSYWKYIKTKCDFHFERGTRSATELLYTNEQITSPLAYVQNVIYAPLCDLKTGYIRCTGWTSIAHQCHVIFIPLYSSNFCWWNALVSPFLDCMLDTMIYLGKNISIYSCITANTN